MKSNVDSEIDRVEYQIQELKKTVAELRRQRPPEQVRDYAFQSLDDQEVMLSELFGERSELILIHNMGIECSYCTMWADGFNGLYPYLSDRAAFAVTAPNSPAALREFAAARSWQFPLFSASMEFIDDMGFLHPDDGLMPGVSTFERAADRSMIRIAQAEFGPGDDFCSVWHFFDLLSKGVNDWEPRNPVRQRDKTSPLQ